MKQQCKFCRERKAYINGLCKRCFKKQQKGRWDENMAKIYMVNVGKGKNRITAGNRNFYKKSRAEEYKEALARKGIRNPRVATYRT